MPKYKIIYNRKECIGVGACVSIAEKFWEMNDDTKADLKGGELNEKTGFYEKIVEESEYEEALESARVCPVEVIIIEKIEDSGEIKRIHPEESK